MNRVIEIIVSPEGKTRIETKGFIGDSCRHASKFLEAALGTAASETLTGEFHESNSLNTIKQEEQSDPH